MAPRQHPAKRDADRVFLTRAALLGWSSRRTAEEAKKANHATLAELSHRTIADRLTAIRVETLRRNKGKLDKLVESALETLGAILEFSLPDVADYDGEDDLRPLPLDAIGRGPAAVLRELAIEKKVVATTEDGEQVLSIKRKVGLQDKVAAAKAVLSYAAAIAAQKDNAPDPPGEGETVALLEKGIAALAPPPESPA